MTPAKSSSPTRLRIGIALAILILLTGLILHFGRQGYRSSTFAGPEFHSLDAGDIAAVHTDLTRHLILTGYAPTSSPSPMDSWAGIHAAGSKRTWFVKNQSPRQATYIAIDLEPATVRTSVKWEARGTRAKLELAERHAYSTALRLDTWLASLTQPNTLSPHLREAKRHDYQQHLVESP